ncbi:hypothetical protein RND81_04G012100 [Saponaria officinalis]|uniref:Uncharacterized protein n=2 Tax=Saponaria officinalis TaxID=3572 RepID=A0AAW1LJ50_SAPOF
MSNDSSCDVGETIYVEGDSSIHSVLSEDSKFEDLLNIIEEDPHEEVLIEVSEGNEEVVEVLSEVGEHTTVLIESEGMSINFQERRVKDDEKVQHDDLLDILPQSQESPTTRLKETDKVRPTYMFSFPYLLLPMGSLSYKEPYRDLVASLEQYRGSDKFRLLAFTSFVHVLFQLILSCYYYFTDSFASLFDRLLRALSCSSLDLTNA